MAGTFGPGLQLFTSPQQLPGTAWVLAPWGQGGRSPAASACNPERPPPATHAPFSTQRSLQGINPHPVGTACVPSRSNSMPGEVIKLTTVLIFCILS